MKNIFRGVWHFRPNGIVSSYFSTTPQRTGQPKSTAVQSSSIDKERSENSFKHSPSVIFEESKEMLADDVTVSPTHLKFDSEQDTDDSSTMHALQGFSKASNGLLINSKSELQLKDNPLALQALTEGKIDLRDKRIQVQTMDSTDRALLGDSVHGLHQISLGNVDVLPNNSVLLEDIDVNNIPEDKDIILDKNTKILLAVGKKVTKKKSRQTVIIDEEAGDGNTQAESSKNEDTSKKNNHEIQITKKIFEELSLEEYKGKYLSFVEKEFVTFDLKMLLRALISTLPVMILAGYFFQTAGELFRCKRNLHLMEDQLLSSFMKTRQSLQADILLNDPSFDRQTLFPSLYQKNK